MAKANEWDIKLSDEFESVALEEMNRKRLQIVGYLLARIIQRSPVDTGAFRGSHRVAVGEPVSTVEKTEDASGAGTLAAGITAAKSAKGYETVYVQNNLPYALALEYGHSQQAPEGIYRLSIEDTKAHFNELF